MQTVRNVQYSYGHNSCQVQQNANEANAFELATIVGRITRHKPSSIWMDGGIRRGSNHILPHSVVSSALIFLSRHWTHQCSK